MFGNYIIFDLEPNKDYIFGILKFSWIICKFNEFNKLITLSSTDYFIKQNDPKFRNHIFKIHGISNKKLELEGEPLEYVLERFAEDIKTFEIDYICGFKIKNKNQDLNFIFKYADKYNLTSLKKDFIQKKHVIIDVYDVLALWLKKNNISIKITYEDAYPWLFNKSRYPKSKYHNTSVEIQHCRNILFKLIVSDIEIFDDFKPLIDEKIDFQKIDELKDIIDGQLLEQNTNLKEQNHKLESRILELELDVDQYKELYEEQTSKEKELETDYMNIRDDKIRLECKKEEYENEIRRLKNALIDVNNKFKNHELISKTVIDQLKNKVKGLNKPFEKRLDEYLDDKYSEEKYDVNLKECFVCSKKVNDICDNCLKYFCDLHVTVLNDGFSTAACDKCFNKVYDKYNQYSLNQDITLL